MEEQLRPKEKMEVRFLPGAIIMIFLSEVKISNLFFIFSLAFILGVSFAYFFNLWFILNFLLATIFYLKFRNLKISLILLFLLFLGSFYFLLRKGVSLSNFQTPVFIKNYRNFLEGKIKQSLPFPQENLLRGIFLGANFEDKEVKNQFINSGLIHITAVSGQNLTLMFSIFYEALKYLPFLTPNLIFFLSLFLIIFFVLLMGFEGNVWRAGIMGFFLVLAKHKLGRLVLKRNMIILSLLIFVLVMPTLIFDNVGTQLSFLAIIGIFFLAPLLEEKFLSFLRLKFLSKTLSEIISAQIFTLPLILYKFGNLNLLSVFANFFVLPILPYLMTIAGVFLFLPINYLLFLCMPFLNYTLFIADVFSRTVIYFRLPLIVVLTIYLVLIIEIYLYRKNETIDFNFDFN